MRGEAVSAVRGRGGQRGRAASRLSDAQLDDLRTRAAQTAGRHVDPGRLRKIQEWWSPELREWAAAVVGHAVGELVRLTWRECVLLDLAHDLEPAPPPPPALVERREAARAAAEEVARIETALAEATEKEWGALRAALVATLSVDVAVAHNYTSVRHYEGYVQGGEHILVLGDLHVGQLVRRSRQPLCWAPSRARHLSDFGYADDPQDRWPNCKACLRVAYRLAGRAPSELLMSTRGRRWHLDRLALPASGDATTSGDVR